jgi:hypothetical protein
MTLKKIGVMISIIAIISVSALLIWLWVSHSSNRSKSNFSISNTSKAGFTFFQLHRDTKLTKSVREELKERLGADAIETKTIIDLIIPARAEDIFKTYFPELTELNKALNYLPEERVEHDTTRLIFRYARKKGLPFDNVRLLFDNKTQLPLFFSIKAKSDGTELIKKLQTKYGPSQDIDWKLQAGKTLFWKQDDNLLLATLTQNRIGAPEHYLGFYFINNINALINLESQQRKIKKGTGAAF